MTLLTLYDIITVLIKSYKNKESEAAANGEFVKNPPRDLATRIKMRIDRINAAVSLDDLRVPPSHRLEALRGNRKGQHSIRVNQQWRVCFKWNNGNAYNVEIVDYH